MIERDGPEKPSRLTELREKLGALVGKRPEWFDEDLWNTRSPAERHMINAMHYRGKAAFTVLRSAETGLKNYTRATKE